MKYLSVCSGIEAATVAWHGLGWEPVAFAEIEAFPAAVLAHHYPTVPNLGDLTKYREWPEELLVEVELLAGGTPCQAFSVAGQRRSLDDERGNLSLVYVNLYHHINEVRKRHGRPPAIALWENVPGVLSTKDNAFGCFIGGLLGCDEAPQTESGKWDKAGFLSSETVRVGYRVLDAQYFGVAQRRRRVFLAAVPCELVERFGERACPSEILSLRESVLGYPPSRGAAWEGASRDTTACTASRSGCGEPFYLDRASFNQGENAQYEPQITNDGVAAAAVARGPGAVMWSASDQANAERLIDQAGTLNCNLGQRGGWIAGCQDPVAFTKAKRAQSSSDDESWVPGEIAPTQNQFDQGDTRATTVVAFTQNSRDEVRQINGGGSVAGALSADAGMHQTNYLAFANRTRDGIKVPEVMKDGVVPALTNPGNGGRADAVNIASAMQVRRLCPSECEALQGFPIGYTDVQYRKKSAADGPRYRALGNSMAVPCMWWLGHRIHQATR